MCVLFPSAWIFIFLHPSSFSIPQQQQQPTRNTITMRFTTALIFASLAHTASGFSAVVPSSTGTPAPVDKSMRGVDPPDTPFDPTEGETSALTRNNKDQVWVSQVRYFGRLYRLRLSILFGANLAFPIYPFLFTASSSSSQPQKCYHERNGQRKYCHAIQFYLPAFYS